MADIEQQQTNHASAETAQAPPQRKKLNLKPRNPDAAARIEAERQQSSGKVCWESAKGQGRHRRVSSPRFLCNGRGCRGRDGYMEPFELMNRIKIYV